jgi:hypothetical protein
MKKKSRPSLLYVLFAVTSILCSPIHMQATNPIFLDTQIMQRSESEELQAPALLTPYLKSGDRSNSRDNPPLPPYDKTGDLIPVAVGASIAVVVSLSLFIGLGIGLYCSAVDAQKEAAAITAHTARGVFSRPLSLPFPMTPQALTCTSNSGSST